MNASLTQKLFDAYPRLYRHVNKSNVHFLNCGEGWFTLIEKASAAIETQALKDNCNDDNWPSVNEIYQKYGTLRIDVGAASNEIYDITSSAEEKSAHVCELCSEKGKTYPGFWDVTRCKQCKDHA